MVKVPNISPLRWWFLMLQKNTNITLTKTNSKLNPSKNTKNINRHQYEARSGRYQTLTGLGFFCLRISGDFVFQIFPPGKVWNLAILHTPKKTTMGVWIPDPLVSRSAGKKNHLQLNISRKKVKYNFSWKSCGLKLWWSILGVDLSEDAIVTTKDDINIFICHFYPGRRWKTPEVHHCFINFFIYLIRPLFFVNSPKTRPKTPIKARVVWVLGKYIYIYIYINIGYIYI